MTHVRVFLGYLALFAAWLRDNPGAALVLSGFLSWLGANIAPRQADPPASGWRRAVWYGREYAMLLSRYDWVGALKGFGVAETTPLSQMKSLAPDPGLRTFPPKPAPPAMAVLVHLPSPPPLPFDSRHSGAEPSDEQPPPSPTGRRS